jgi:hypothetical protein
MRRINGLRSVAEMVQNPLDDCGFLDTGDHPQRPAALPAGLDINGEYALEALCPAHRPLPIGGRCLATLSDSACPGHDPCPVAARRCEHAVVPGQVRAGFWHQRDESRNKVLGLDKIAGSDFGQPKAGPKGGGQDARSNITCVVPSRYGVFSA